MSVDRVLILVADAEAECFLRLNPQDSSEREDEFISLPLMGMAFVAMDKKKTLVVADPVNFIEYKPDIDLTPSGGNPTILCVPIMDRDGENIEGCIELEFKRKNYLSGNPLSDTALNEGPKKGKIDIVSKEILEIFANQLRIVVSRIKA